MRFAIAVVFLIPGLSFAQPDAKKETVKWVLAQEDPGGGFRLAPKDAKGDAKPGLRATNGAVRALKYLGVEVPNKDKHAAFVLKCYDPKTGAFAEPGGKPDVTITAIGVMAATELGIPKDKYAKAMGYLKENAKTFEDVRIGAAAVEAWGVKDCPFKLDEWVTTADAERASWKPPPNPKGPSGYARALGSYQAFRLRLGLRPNIDAQNEPWLGDTQWADGGWGKDGEKASDVESTYRVMRALMLLKERPKDVAKLREFVAAHRNKDDGYATKPGDPSTVSGAYYAAIVTKWLDEMEKK